MNGATTNGLGAALSPRSPRPHEIVILRAANGFIVSIYGLQYVFTDFAQATEKMKEEFGLNQASQDAGI